MHDSNLLMNLVAALAVALVGATIAARLRQSVIIGYLLAGIVIGPYSPGFTGDIETVEALAEIGIILLMFTIGLEFDLRDLVLAGRVSVLGSSVQVGAIIGIGTLVGLALGWEPIEALFFGAVISISSSTVLAKVLGERGEMDTAHGKLALAWSAMQDIYTIILIVILSALATDSDQLVLDLMTEVGKAALFLVLLVPVGLYLLPWLLSQVAALRNREVFILTVTAVALGLAYGSSFFGLSLALGAFVAGIVVSETDLSHQVLGELLPLRDIFSGLFFVSVGMLVDPGFVIRNIPLLLLTVALILIVKGALSAAIAWFLGAPTRTAVLVGTIMGVSAEFSFLLAQVGQDVEAVSADVFSLMLAGSAVSIMLFPLAYRGMQPLATSLGNRRPGFRVEKAVPLPPEADALLRGHAVICGYGRVGSEIGRVLGQRFAVVVIEEDPRVVQNVRAAGGLVIQGNSAIPAVFEQANPGRARALIIALPDPMATRQIVDYVRERYPRLDVVVRTHSEEERQYLLRRGVDEVILGEYELALEMTRHALQRFGLGTIEAHQIVQRLRGQIPPEELTPQREGARRERSAAAVRRRDRLAGALGVARTGPEPVGTTESAPRIEVEAPAPRPEPGIGAAPFPATESGLLPAERGQPVRRSKVHRPAGTRHRGEPSATTADTEPVASEPTPATASPAPVEPAEPPHRPRREPRPRPPEPRHRVQRRPIYGPPSPDTIESRELER